ncbi:MAG: UDP-N-acetylglucosamine 4,6-dehydratase (inverting) [Candidatus Aureabacteria bacterium]|nr:UDP-N-acetylglucosamine 4,6-dehydratase (inverting) [Candidatus Auribacterota bacterium]
MSFFKGKKILITGGTGSLGNAFIERMLKDTSVDRLIIYSRDEYKQDMMKKKFSKHEKRLRYFIGNVRDRIRLSRAFEGVDYVVHAAALKQVPAIEYNPIEAIKTNIYGAENIIDVALDNGVKKVVALSTDKSVHPANMYGATKMVSDKLFVSANAYVGKKETRFSVVRYGNIAGSRGSVVPYFKALIDNGASSLPITDARMTRFWITLDQGVDLVLEALKSPMRGEIYVAKIPSFKITDLATAMGPHCKLIETGIRVGEKLHEIMITEEDSRTAYEYANHYIIYPSFEWWHSSFKVKTGGKKAREGFRYTSDSNKEWLDIKHLKKRLSQLKTEK